MFKDTSILGVLFINFRHSPFFKNLVVDKSILANAYYFDVVFPKEII